MDGHQRGKKLMLVTPPHVPQKVAIPWLQRGSPQQYLREILCCVPYLKSQKNPHWNTLYIIKPAGNGRVRRWKSSWKLEKYLHWKGGNFLNKFLELNLDVKAWTVRRIDRDVPTEFPKLPRKKSINSAEKVAEIISVKCSLKSTLEWAGPKIITT